MIRFVYGRHIQRISFLLVILLVLSLSCNSCNQVPKDKGQFYKGNLHAHSFWSDGDHFPEMVMDWYKQHNYQFAVLSDHNILQQGEKWIHANRNETLQLAYQSCKDRFKIDWIFEKESNDSLFVRLKTIDEYRTILEKQGQFIIIQSEEITDAAIGKPVHLNAINLLILIPPQHGNTIQETLQNNANAINQQKQELEIPLLGFINHPNFGWAIKTDHLVNTDGIRFFEVFNGHPSVRNYGDSLHPGTEKMWDIALIERLKSGKEILYGLATDDAHNYHEFTSNRANPGRGWICVRTKTLEPAAIIKAIQKGDFYGSTGVVLNDFNFTGKKIKINIQQEDDVNYTTQFIGCIRGEANSKILKEVEGIKPVYKLNGNELYVRAKIISSKLKENPFQKGDYEVAWLQPVIPTP